MELPQHTAVRLAKSINDTGFAEADSHDDAIICKRWCMEKGGTIINIEYMTSGKYLLTADLVGSADLNEEKK